VTQGGESPRSARLPDNATIGIAGLGLIGGSLAKSIKARTKCRVLGFYTREDVVVLAKEEGVIDGGLTDSVLGECACVIVALYPDVVVSYCDRRLSLMKRGALLVDCAGVKTKVCAALSALAKQRGVRFVGGHPMAGVEKSGFAASFAGLFDNATMILCEDEYTDPAALESLSAFFLSLGFASIKITTAKEHDEIIAYTSQLAHVVSSVFMQSDTAQKRYGFSAGSFKDLTRVAKLNEDMWTSLFFENRDNLLKETDTFLLWMKRYRAALDTRDIGAMKALLKNGTARKIADEAEEETWRKR
jgi:prephenate dehydrogenase